MRGTVLTDDPPKQCFADQAIFQMRATYGKWTWVGCILEQLNEWGINEFIELLAVDEKQSSESFSLRLSSSCH
jgi:hypothetical protein